MQFLWPVLLALAARPGLHAQAPDIQWQRCLGGSSGEMGYRIQVAADGGYVLGGFATSTDGDVTGNHGTRDYWMAKLDAAGSLQWQHCYGGTGSETAYGLTAMPDGGWALSGRTASTDGDAGDCPPGPGTHAWVVRTDGLGAIAWEACLGGSGNYGAGFTDAVATADGGLVLAGGTSYPDGIGAGNHGGDDFLLVKLDASGMVEWSHCYGGSGSEGANAIRATADGGYVVAGPVQFAFDGDVTTGEHGGIWVIKIGPEGELEWNRRMGGDSPTGQSDEVRDIAQTPDGGYLVVGSTGSNGGDVSGNHGGMDAWLVKLDADGSIVQQRCIGGTGNDIAYRVAYAGMDRYTVVGNTGSNDGDVIDNPDTVVGSLRVFMVDANLNLLWQKNIGGSLIDVGYGIARSADNGTILTGYTSSNDGDVSGNHGSLDAWVVKLGPDPDTGVREDEQGSIVVFPSPASDVLHVHLPAGLAGNHTLDVVDVTGHIVLRQAVQAGSTGLQLAVHALAQGTYCLRLWNAREDFTTRFVKY
jgi:hypothetical protein